MTEAKPAADPVSITASLRQAASAVATARRLVGCAIHLLMQDAPTSGISRRQNEPAQIQLLQAQRFLYDKAKRLIVLQLALVVALPIAAATLSVFVPDPTLRAALALVALVIGLIDITVLDRHQKRTITDAAKVQEAFDCKVMDLPWDLVTVGEPVDEELIIDASLKYAARHGSEDLQDWYPTQSDLVPLLLGRLICQRSALAYDSALRRRYAAIVLALPIFVLVALVLAAMVNGLTVEVLVLSVVAPASPAAVWAVREYFRHTEASDTNDSLRRKIDGLWQRVLLGHCTAEGCSVETRTIQSELFRGRKGKTPILGWVYRAMRSGLEARMRTVASKLAADSGQP